MIVLAVMLAGAAALPNYKMPAAKLAKCAKACAAQYRIPASADDDDSLKDRAVANDGSKCDVVGAKRCSTPTRTIFRAGEDPIDTLRSAMSDN